MILDCKTRQSSYMSAEAYRPPRSKSYHGGVPIPGSGYPFPGQGLPQSQVEGAHPWSGMEYPVMGHPWSGLGYPLVRDGAPPGKDIEAVDGFSDGDGIPPGMVDKLKT